MANPGGVRLDDAPNPRVGMLAIVRNRRGVISEVRDFDGADGRLHVVRVDYRDDQRPLAEDLVWELEPYRRVLEPGELPSSRNPAMVNEDFDALVRAARWTAISPYLDPDGQGWRHGHVWPPVSGGAAVRCWVQKGRGLHGGDGVSARKPGKPGRVRRSHG